MAEKFSITAELQLVLDSGLDAKIAQLKKKAEQSGINIPITIGERNFQNFYKQLNSFVDIANKSKRKIQIGIGLDNVSLKSFYRELRLVTRSADNSKQRINIKVGLDNNSLKQFYQEVNAIFTSSEKSKRFLGFRVGIDREALKFFYTELKAVIAAANTSKQRIGINVFANIDPVLNDIINKLTTFQSKSVTFSVKVSRASVVNVQALQAAIKAFNQELLSLDVSKISSFAKNVSLLAKSVRELYKFSNKKLSFDFAVKDINQADKLAKIVERIGLAFDKAYASSSKFNTALAQTSGLINALKTAFGGLDFSGLNIATKNLNKLTSKKNIASIKDIAKSTDDATDSIYDLGVQSGITLKRFGAYTLVTALFFRLSFAIRNAISEFVDFNEELVKVRQVTQGSIGQTQALADEITRLATGYGVSSLEIAKTAQVLGQAGFNAEDTRKLLEGLTKTELAATFEGIEDTTEAVIAAISQFGIEVEDVEGKLDSINAVAAAFAVESSDITKAIQKTGGAFAAAGGNLEELIALFTSVRATTRESADTIATGLRTIFTRIQRVRTGRFLQNLGIEIRATRDDVEELSNIQPDIKVGDFVGPFEAIRRISKEVVALGGQDPRFAQIAEELGGFRQINKVIPLLKEFGTAQNALNVAIAGQGSLTRDAIVAQESYANQLQKVKEEFLSLIREFAEDEQIKEFIFLLLDLSKAAIEVAKSLKQVIGPLAIVSSIGAVRFIDRYVPGIREGVFGKRKAFNQGGLIPGGGEDKDNVLIQATKGEYIIRKRRARELGKPALDALNRGKANIIPGYNTGGLVGAANKAGSIAGVGVAGFLALTAFTDLEDIFDSLGGATKEVLTGIGGMALQLGILLPAIKYAAPTFKQFRDKANKFTRNFVDQAPRDVVKQVSDIRPLEEQARQRAPQLVKNRATSEKIAENLKVNISSLNGQINSLSSRIDKSNQLERDLSSAARENIRNANSNIKESFVYPTDFDLKGGSKKQYTVRDDSGNARTFTDIDEARRFAFTNNQSYRTSISRARDKALRIGRLRRGRDQLSNQIAGLNLTRQDLLGYLLNEDQSIASIDDTSRRDRNILRQGEELRAQRQRRLNRRQLLRATVENTSRAAGFGAVATVAGNFISNQLQRSAIPTEETQGNRDIFGIGGGLSGAATGGATGALLGSALGPAGTAIGAVAGTFIGALTGTASSLQEFDQQLQKVSANRSLDNLDNIFKNIESGRTTASTARLDVLTNLRNLRTTFVSTKDSETRQEIRGGISNSAVNIQKFIDETARASKSLPEFTKKIDDATLRFFTATLGLNFNDFKKNIDDTIKITQKLNETESQLVNSIQEFDLIVRASLAFGRAFEDAASQVNSFTNNLESFAFGGSGIAQRPDQLSSRLSDLSNLGNTQRVEGIVAGFAGQFGQAGQQLGKTVTESIRASNILPDILLNLRSGSQLAEEGDLQIRFDDLLKDFGVTGEAASLLSARLDDLLGEDFKDSNFFAALNKDFPKAVADLVAGLEQPVQAFASAYAKSNEELNTFSERLASISQINQGIFDGIQKQFNNFSSLIQARENFSGRDLSGQLIATERNRTRVATGDLTPDQLLANILQARGEIQTLTQNRDNTEDLEARARLTVSINEQQQKLEKANRALNFLADSTNELAAVQNALNKEQEKRLGRRDIALDFAFGGQGNRTRLQRTQGFAEIAARSGSVNGIPQEFLSDVRSFLERLGSNEVGNTGITGKEALDRIVRDAAPLGAQFANSGQPGQAELNLQAQIEDLISRQIEAQENLNKVLIRDRNLFFTQLNNDFNRFLQNLQTNLQEESKQRKTFEKQNIENQLFGTIDKKTGKRTGGLQNQLDIVRNIRQRFGENALANAGDIANLSSKFNENANFLTTIDALQKGVSGDFVKLNKNRKNTFAFGESRISKDEFNQTIGKRLFQVLSPEKFAEFQNKLQDELALNNIGFDVGSGTVSRQKLEPIITEILQSLKNEAVANKQSLNTEREQLISNVGGEANFENILKNADSIIAQTKNLPKDIDFQSLSKEVNELQDKLQNLTNQLSKFPASQQQQSQGPPIPPRRFAFGGSVPGQGNSDTVPALLTPGEFVLTKKAVQKYGLETLQNINNAAKFANGGLVKPGRFIGRIKSDDLENFDKSEIPKTILSILSKYGVNIDVADKVTDIDQSLRFQKPRGQNIKFDDVKGLYRDSEKRILIRNDVGRNVLTHEIGHAFDYSKGTLSDHKIFIAGYQKDISKFNEEQRKKFQYLLQKGAAGRREAFATIFDSVIRNNSSSAKDFPESTKLITGAINKAEIDNLHNDYLALKRDANVENPDYQAILNRVAKVQNKIASSRVKDDSRVKAFSEILEKAVTYYSDKRDINLTKQQIVRRNSGGIVPGNGNTDSVPALLTPGEYVISKPAVKKHGISAMNKLNGVQKFQDGGLVQPTSIIDAESINRFNSAVNQLAIQVENMKQTFASIPTEIVMNGTHRLDVYINGAQAFTQMKQEFSNLVMGEIKKSINKLLKTKFPQLGSFDG